MTTIAKITAQAATIQPTSATGFFGYTCNPFSQPLASATLDAPTLKSVQAEIARMKLDLTESAIFYVRIRGGRSPRGLNAWTDNIHNMLHAVPTAQSETEVA